MDSKQPCRVQGTFGKFSPLSSQGGHALRSRDVASRLRGGQQRWQCHSRDCVGGGGSGGLQRRQRRQRLQRRQQWQHWPACARLAGEDLCAAQQARHSWDLATALRLRTPLAFSAVSKTIAILDSHRPMVVLTQTWKSQGAVPGIEPGTSRTLSENHATRPNSQMRMHCQRWCCATLLCFELRRACAIQNQAKPDAIV